MRLFLGLLLVIASAVAARAADGETEQVRRLVSRLSSPDFHERETVTAELDRVGEPALDALRQAAKTGDAETRRRATTLVERIGRRQVSARLLAPTLVTLNYENVPLVDAVSDLSRRIGISVTLHGDAPRTEGRAITLFADKVSAWRAVQLFCNRAGMHEWDGLSPLPGIMVLPAQNSFRNDSGSSGEGLLVLGQMNVRRGQVSALSVTSPAPRVALIDGAGPRLPAQYSGSVRVRAAPPDAPFNAETGKDIVLALQVSADSRLHVDGATDLRIERAIDEHGQNHTGRPIWTDPPDPTEDLPRGMRLPPQITERKRGPVAIRFARDESGPKKLVELAGVVTVKSFAAEPVVQIANPERPLNQTVKQADVTLSLLSFARRVTDEAVEVEVRLPYGTRLETPVAGPIGIGARAGRFWNNFVVDQSEPTAASGTEYQGLSLYDADGKVLPAVTGETSIVGLFPEYYTIRIGATFRSSAAGAPSRLAFAVHRPMAVEVPFVLRDVPLR